MPTTVDIPPEFYKAAKQLKRKYPSVMGEIRKLVVQLENDERPSDKVPGGGHDVYKVRLRNPSASKGKSGGFRVIYYLRLADKVTLVTIYSKSDQSDISPEIIRKILEEIISSDEDESDDAE